MALFWTQRQDIGPDARSSHALAYDAARQQTILFGGSLQAGSLFDTWSWDGSDWTQLQDIGPEARYAPAMCFDSARKRIVLFGGGGGAGGGAAFADTWEWDGADWTQVQDTGPSARYGQAMCFDSARGRIVLFGGHLAGLGGAKLADTWEWDGSDWTQVHDEGPSPRFGHAMCFDSQAQRALLFGGSAISDTWAFDNESWTQIAHTGPPPCEDTALVFAGATFLFGGYLFGQSGPNSVLGATWELDGDLWTERQDIGPAPRFGHAMSFDSGRTRIVLFGGYGFPVGVTSGFLGDTWELPVPAPAEG